ncbi:MAG: DNA adenine methylase [Chloroflexi bacterium]|nr:DNA adenine methylase [Chloroflexota bacterium]
MGSKQALLKNGLGKLLFEQSYYADRIVDLFCGSSAVSWFIAEHTTKPVLAVDLQSYATCLAESVIGRTQPIDYAQALAVWIDTARRASKHSIVWRDISLLTRAYKGEEFVSSARALCQDKKGTGLMWRAYGGHYFSPAQSAKLDFLMRHLPDEPCLHNVCLAALIIAASRCAASPGHTAQPFQPTQRSIKFIFEAWDRDPFSESQNALQMLCGRHANAKGETLIADAVEVAKQLKRHDLVFVDPPYSDVHYSRFYHVLETIARGKCGPITGVGRYPPYEERPQSDFSLKSRASNAVKQLLNSLASAGARVVLTFPKNECSNGLSGESVIEIAREWFHIVENAVDSRFSTLGGNNSYRAARLKAHELILLMEPM